MSPATPFTHYLAERAHNQVFEFMSARRHDDSILCTSAMRTEIVDSEGTTWRISIELVPREWDTT